MILLSVNVSLPKEVPYQGRTVSTGIFKEPVGRRVMLRRLNLEGDGQADRNLHGGINKAVYAYPFEHYAYWSHELGRTDFTFGQFGENFTVSGMLEDRQNLEGARNALRLSSLAPEWRGRLEKRLKDAGIPIE